MENALKKNNNRFILIGKINGLASESKRARSRIKRAETPEEKYPITNRKQWIGYNTRYHLLAYAFLRGIPYRKVEAKCGEYNSPNAGEIFKIVEAHAPTWIPYDSYSKTGGKKYSPTLADINVWLASVEKR
jgi:hypothetical protein